MSVIREAAQLQESYQALVDEKRLSKRAMCSLCIPFRDKYGLTDLQTLRIARKEMELSEMVDLLEGGSDGEVPTFTNIETLGGRG